MRATEFDQKTAPSPGQTTPCWPPVPPLADHSADDAPALQYCSRWQLAHELMTHEIRDILIVSSPYNIFKLEEDGSFQSGLDHEYKGLHLGYPPRITGAASDTEALWLLANKRFDMVLMVPHPEAFDAVALGAEIKKRFDPIPSILLVPDEAPDIRSIIDRGRGIFNSPFIWSGRPDLLLAIVKNTEDHLNAIHDTRKGSVRVVILVEDAPEYYSFFLPVLYREIFRQTESLLKTGHNEKKKLLTVKTRPKVLLARNYEEAEAHYQQYKSYLLCMISDTRFHRRGKEDARAGVALLSRIRDEIPEIPLVLMSSEPDNKRHAGALSALFLDKTVPNLPREIQNHILPYLGFGDFVFRSADGRPVDRAANLLQLEAKLHAVPPATIRYHAERNHFSTWLMARGEIELALRFRAEKKKHLNDMEALRGFLVSNVHALRRHRQRGVISTFDRNHFDATVRDFVKIGQG